MEVPYKPTPHRDIELKAIPYIRKLKAFVRSLTLLAWLNFLYSQSHLFTEQRLRCLEMSSLPHILFVAGFWEGTSVFDSLVSLLRSHNYLADVIPLPSTGTKSPGNPSMKDDVAAIRKAITSTIDEDGEVLLVLHSAGAFLGSMAIEGLSVGERKEKGLEGGVGKIVFLARAVWEEGFQHGPLPFFDYQVTCAIIFFSFRMKAILDAFHVLRSKVRFFEAFWLTPITQGDEMFCVTPEKLLFNDLSPEEAAKWVKKLSCQPPRGWDDVVDYVGWKNVPSVYLVSEGDALLNKEMQLQFAQRAASEVERCSAGHCSMIGQPERCLEVVRKAAGEVL